LPAVVVPSGSKTGFSSESFARVVSERMLSSASTSPTRTISSEKRPPCCASDARRCERYAHASCSSREMPSSRATFEFCWTMCSSSNVDVSPSKTIESIRSPFPSR
jgi:hypothetical protein